MKLVALAVGTCIPSSGQNMLPSLCGRSEMKSYRVHSKNRNH